MIVLLVIFVVLMILWLFGGWYVTAGDPRQFGATHLIPWLCVAILGWVLFHGP